jgi:hypothetical protein
LRDLEWFVTREAIAACVSPGRIELPPLSSLTYVAFLDFAGGSGGDSAPLALAHGERRGDQNISVLDLVREARPPFSPERVCADFASVLTQYGVDRAVSDRWGGEFPIEQMRKHGIAVEPSAKAKSELYGELLPLLNSGTAELLDHARLLAQLGSLERRTARGGRDSIDHPPGGHDDLINAACGALLAARLHASAMSEDERLACLRMGPPCLTS